MLNQNWRRWSWKLASASLSAMGGAIACLGDCASAQITPDGTLINNSVVTPQGNTSLVEGGTQAGSNLFHSFEQFSVPTGGEASFNNAADIQNIISRVTGKSISNIDGLLQANGTANLFLLNPNGIIFGPNASLNIGGSFLGSTASSLNFADGTQFSATAQPTTSLLTVSVPLGLQFGGTAASIINRSRATNSSGQRVGLQVLPGKTLSLMGGDVRLDGGRLEAPGGRVELGGVAGAGSLGLFVDSNNLIVSFPDDVARADVYLTNSSSNTARVNVASSNGGNIAITARNINIVGESLLRGGLETNSGFPGAQAGDIELRAIEAINIANSYILNNVRTESVGNGGNINVTTGSLSLRNGAQLAAETFGQGNAGSVNINARNTISFDEVGNNGSSSGAFSTVRSTGKGKGGNINISTGSLAVTSGAQLNATTFGQGDAGSVNINARDTVSLDGVGSNGFPSGANSTVESGAVGNGGSINITTGSLSASNSAQLGASTSGKGNAGSVNINARNTISFDEVSRALSGVEYNAVGNGGSVNITTRSLSLTNGAQLGASTFGKGNAGSVNINARDTISLDGVNSDGFNSGANSTVGTAEAVGYGGSINITTGSLSVTNGAGLSTSTHGQGNAGSVNVNARERVSFDGVSSDGAASGALSNVTSTAVGNGGSINITTGSLAVSNGAQLRAATFGKGNAGSVNVNARDVVSFDGVSSNGFSSGAFSSVRTGAVGKGGGINIITGSLSVTNGAQLQSQTRGQGNAGSVTISARDTVSFDGVSSDGFSSAAFSTVEAGSVGNGGGIDITTELLSVSNGALLSASSRGSGAAGNIEVDARSIRLDNQAFLSSDTVAGQGNIFLRSQDLVLRRGSNITTDATGTAEGGNITIDTGVIAALEDSDISANAQDAFGGRVIIDAQGIFGTEFREIENPATSDITATSELGPEFSGTVEINTPDVDPSRGLVNLPAQLTDSEVAQACTPGRSQAKSEFVITGRGGLPPNPGDALSTDAVMVDLVTLNPEVAPPSTPAASPSRTSSTASPIAEAQGWVIDAKGNVTLIANAPTLTPYSDWLQIADCRAFNQQQWR